MSPSTSAPRPRLCFLSLHTSPLAMPGTTKAGGMNVYVRALARELAALGYTIDIYTRRSAPTTPTVLEDGPGVRVITVAAGPPQPLGPEALAEHVDAFVEGAARFAARDGAAYALVHSHYWLSGLAGIALAERWAVPHVAMFHTLGEVKNRARRGEAASPERIDAERRIVRDADRLICATAHERTFLVDLYGAHAPCVRIVPGGVDLERFRPGDRDAARAALGLPGGPLALFVGRLEPLKGADILLRAAAIVDLDTPLTVVIVGGETTEDSERSALTALATELGLADQVRFVGSVERERLAHYYRAADVLVAPSHYESFGLAAVEALASGTPVIATRVGGLQSTIRDGQSGYLVPWRCPEPFAERLETLLSNPDLRARFGEAARRSVAGFGWADVAAAVAGIYADLDAGDPPCRDEVA